MGLLLQFVLLVFLKTLALSKVNGDSSQQSNEAKFDDVKDLPTSLKRHGSALPPRSETRFDVKIKPNNSFTRFLTPQNGQQPEEAKIEKLKQLALEKNSVVKNGQNNSVDAVQKQHPQQSAVQKNVPGNDGHSGIPLAIQQEKPHMKPPPVAVPSHQTIPIPSQTHAQSPQQPSSVIRSDSKMPINPEAEYNQGKFREELEYAERTPELWFANVKWSCPKGDEKCKEWEKIYVAIERYITMARKLAMGEEVPLEMVAARPDFDPKKLDRTQTNVTDKLQFSRIFNLQREEIPSQLNIQKEEGEPLYVENGEMEMVLVMRMVELIFKMNKQGANIQNNPVYMLNEELVEKVYQWAAFYADAIKFLKSGKIEKFYKIDKDIDKVLKGSLFKPVMTMIQTLDDFAREKERAQIILERIRKEKGIDDQWRLPFRYSFPPLPLELTDQVIHAQKKDILNESMQEREKFANLWQSIVETLRKEKAKKTVERYALRQRNEQPRITHDLVYHVVLPVPRPEEFVHTVYVYANGKPLGKDLAEALVKAENCLDEIRGNMSKQLAELKEECPIPPNIETDRKEKFDAFFDVAKGLKSGLPTFLDKNGRKMDWDEVLPLVEDAFDAIVSGKKLDVFLPTIKREGRIKGMADNYANQIPKQQVPEKPIRPVKGADGMTDAQREFKKRDDEKKHDDEEMKKLKLEKEELEKKKKEMQKIKWAEKQKKDFEARKLEKEKLANEKLEKEELEKKKKEMQKIKWAEKQKKDFEARKLEKEKLANEKLEKEELEKKKKEMQKIKWAEKQKKDFEARKLEKEKLANEKSGKENLRVHGYQPIPARESNKVKEKVAIWPASHRRVVAY